MANVSLAAAYLSLGDTYPVLGNLVMHWLAQIDSKLHQCQSLVDRLAKDIPDAISYLSGGECLLNILLCSATLVMLAIARYLWMLPPRPSQTPKHIDQEVQTVTPDCSFADQIPTANGIEEEVSHTCDDTHQNSESTASISEITQVSPTAHMEAQELKVSLPSTLPEDPPPTLPIVSVPPSPSIPATQEVDEKLSFSEIPTLSEINTPASPQVCVSCETEAPSEIGTSSKPDTAKIDVAILAIDDGTEKKSEDLKPQVQEEQKSEAEPVAESTTVSTTITGSYRQTMVLRDQPLMRPILTPILKPLPSRGVDFMHSTEIIDLTDPRPESPHVALSDQTNSNIQPIDEPATRLQLKRRAHTAIQPDWAVAPSQGPEQPGVATRSVNGRSAKGRRGKKRFALDSSALHV